MLKKSEDIDIREEANERFYIGFVSRCFKLKVNIGDISKFSELSIDRITDILIDNDLLNTEDLEDIENINELVISDEKLKELALEKERLENIGLKIINLYNESVDSNDILFNKLNNISKEVNLPMYEVEDILKSNSCLLGKYYDLL